MFDLLTNYLFPVLAGLTLLTLISRALTIWQDKNRDLRSVAFSVVYVGLFWVFLSLSLSAPLAWVFAGYLTFGLALLVGAFAEWRDLFLWLRQKDKNFQADEAVHTLDEVADDNELMLEAEAASPTHTLEEVAGDNDLVLEAGVKDEPEAPPANEGAPR